MSDYVWWVTFEDLRVIGLEPAAAMIAVPFLHRSSIDFTKRRIYLAGEKYALMAGEALWKLSHSRPKVPTLYGCPAGSDEVFAANQKMLDDTFQEWRAAMGFVVSEQVT